MPQIVDFIANPQGAAFLTRDATNVAVWFAAHGHPGADPAALAALLRTEAGLPE